MSFTTETPKKHISEITAEFKPFWQPIFDSFPNPNVHFTSKLCYMGKEFSTDGSSRMECVRFFPSELNNVNGIYIELYNWDQVAYHTGHRVLYYLPYDPEWKSKTSVYKEVSVNPTSAKFTSTFAVKLTHLTLINQTSVSSSTPIITAPETEDTLFNEDLLTDAFLEMDDDHYTKMTIRDLYCMLQNVPMSNKKWLNGLIEKGKVWQKK
jgi:hypothetical protein